MSTMALTFWFRLRFFYLWQIFMLIFSLIAIALAKEVNFSNLEIKGNDLSQQIYLRQYPQPPFYGGGGCPLCDASVYSYCSYKILHDSCCCDFPVAHLKPQECFYADCSLLYAKSCFEYSLIKNCCCNNPY